MASSPNLSNPNHEFDKTKQYNKVVFQQGKPILDVDLNDMSAALQAQATSALIEKMGYGPSQLDYREWAMTAVDGVTPLSDRNKDNFALTLGRLDTRKGVIDTSSFRSSDNLSPSIIFDYGKIVDNVATDTSDRPYENYLFKGVVSESTTNKIVDSEKNFSPEHRLTLMSHVEVVSPSYANVSSTTTPSFTRATNDHVVQVQEGACRVRFLTGNLAGQEFDILGASATNVTCNLPSPAEVGSEYVILPPNTLEEYRSLYDSAVDQAASKSEGIGGLPRLVTYIQVFEEDVSSIEDTEIQSSALGFETTHRSQLRWCARVAMVRSSIDNDPNYQGVTSALSQEHIFALLADNKFVDYQVLLDSVDANASQHNAYEQSQFWAQTNSQGVRSSNFLSDQESPYADLGLTPMHFFGAEENAIDRMYWSFLKALFLKISGSDYNDFVVLNVFNSESKSTSNQADQESLSEYFVPGAVTDTSVQPLVHAWLSTGSAFEGIDSNAVPATFKAPSRVFHTQADLSADNMKSRTLHGLRGGIIYGTNTNTPLVFPSVNSHLSMIDQMLLGYTGLGSAQGQTRLGDAIPSAIDFTLANTTASVAQSGTGLGAIKMLSPISAATVTAGTIGSFLTGSSSYLLRDKGNRSSHTVNVYDEDLGWSLYKKEDSKLVDPVTNKSDLTLRGWEEGMAQATAFQQGINFRKLAIKTTAHKSMDLFTISEQPAQINSDIGAVRPQDAITSALMIPDDQTRDYSGNLFIDSYSAVGRTDESDSDYLPSNFIPTNLTEFSVKPLLSNYQPTGGVKGFTGISNQDRTVNKNYGPWNRFNQLDIVNSANFTSNGDPLTVVNDLWQNRCTAMRLRYHVGDFYPGELDSRGVPRNLLVDSMNLFMKVEPLSLAHWMTMPKHQHSILENSISFAEGIEALLKVSHGLGDTQKLVNGSNQPLIQDSSPSLSEGGDYQSRSVGDVDPLNLPFEHYKQPFVHWYHPMMHKIKAPHPDGTNTKYTNSDNLDYDITVYPKFGRRSLIVPALVPSIFEKRLYDDSVQSHVFPITRENNYETFPTRIGDSSESDVKQGFTVDISNETDATGLVDGSPIIPYPYHGTNPSSDTGTTSYSADTGSITVRNNQITFPAIGTHSDPLTPTPVFIPAGRVYAQQTGSATELDVGFNPLMTDSLFSQWNDVSSLEEDNFPYDEKSTYYELEAGGAAELPFAFQREYSSWSTPVLRASISTNTVSGIVDLVRTSFETGLETVTLSSDYSFTMPISAAPSNQVPGVGPDNPLDTLFVGDTGTALGGFSNRKGFISPLAFGVPVDNSGLVPNGGVCARDYFEIAVANPPSTGLFVSFSSIANMGLQQKLMWNCSFRVLHARPSGSVNQGASTAPKSLTEMFLVKDRISNGNKQLNFTPSGPTKKPFIHLMSTHPATQANFPNKNQIDHLYPMVSDSTGGPTSEGFTYYPNSETTSLDYSNAIVKTASMGDTYAADPFDYALNEFVLGADNPLREHDLLEKNSGIEVDILSELQAIHSSPDVHNLDEVDSVTGLSFQSMMPTANELTLPGDHELVFVLYTGHYGAKMFDTNDEVSIENIPPVAGCHLTATLEINRPSERTNSTAQSNVHYGVTMNSDDDPINTYSIPSTK